MKNNKDKASTMSIKYNKKIFVSRLNPLRCFKNGIFIKTQKQKITVLPSKKGIPTSCSYLAVTTRESPLSVNGVKGDVILEDPIESD